MKRKFANKIKEGINDYYHKRIDKDYFRGYVSLVKIKNIKKPWIVVDNGIRCCVLDENYEWLEIYPDNEKYAITAMFNNNQELIEWYFDMIKERGVENGIPYIDDLYLDLVIKKNGTEVILDENELLEALNTNDITKKDFDIAYKTMEGLQKKYRGNISELESLTQNLYKEFEYIK